MLLKNLMEEKQLNFNQPLLSVRRFTSTGATLEAEVKRKTDNSQPKLPPLLAYKSEIKSGPIRNPGTVPFLWEQIPGRPKDESKFQTPSIERPPVAPKLPPGRISNVKQQISAKGSEGANNRQFHKGNVLSSSQSVSSSDKITTKCESSIEGMGDTESSSAEEDDEAYVDALDTLSRTESFFFNCSVSGVSGLDNAEVKPSGMFSTDPQIRDFMMGRFLPAAKAMASEAPQHTSRKQPIAQEQPRNIRGVVNMDKRNPPKQYSTNNLHLHSQNEKWEESDDEDDYDGPGNSSTTVCGLFPRLCWKNSFYLLNPVPGMRLQAREPINLVHRAPSRSSYVSSSNEISEKAKNFKVHGSDLQRKASTNFRELLDNESPKCESGLGSPVEKTLYIDSIHKVKSPKLNSSSSDVKRQSDLQGNDLDALLKVGEIEATRSIDTSIQDIKFLNIMGENAEVQLKSLESFDFNFLSSPDRSTHGLQSDAKGSSREDRDLSNNTIQVVGTKVDGSRKIDLESQLHKKLSNQECSRGLILNSVLSTSSGMASDGKTYSRSQQKTASRGQEEFVGNYSQLPLSLPLPKSPSDSWLKRTLPAVSAKNSSPWSSLGIHSHTTRNESSNIAPVDPKWETIVKTSHLQLGHLHFSQEQLAPIPET